MKKYVLKRILFSFFALLVVVMVVMLLVYQLISRSTIFQTDDVWNKKSNNDRTIYEYTMYSKYGYLGYVDYTSFLKNKYYEVYGDDYTSSKEFDADRAMVQNGDKMKAALLAVLYQKDSTVRAFVDKSFASGTTPANQLDSGYAWIKDYVDQSLKKGRSLDDVLAEGNDSVNEFIDQAMKDGYVKIVYLEPVRFKSGKYKPGGNGYLIAVQEKNPMLRLVDYAKGFISVENIHMVQDPELTERYVRVEKDPYSGFYAVVGSGTQHKYLLYVDGRFPFIHQNLFHINLGVSFTRYRGQEISSVITMPTGDMQVVRQQYPADIGTDKYTDTAIDFHSLTYNSSQLSEVEKKQFPDKYTVYTYKRAGMSMLERSFVIGVIATLCAYLLGLPLGVLNALYKDKLFDKLGNAYIIFFSSVPPLAYIFMLAAFGTRIFNLPYKFANATVPILAYILPIVSMTLPQIGSLMKWMRRYMIDQMNSDYVKFARSGGLSEGEIYRVHIFRNALIYIVHGIPSSIIFCLIGAIITERVYAVPGVGNLLTQALSNHDNGIIVACTVFYTSLQVIAVLLGDLLLAKVDPRISLSSDKGGGR